LRLEMRGTRHCRGHEWSIVLRVGPKVARNAVLKELSLNARVQIRRPAPWGGAARATGARRYTLKRFHRQSPRRMQYTEDGYDTTGMP
jgi:hypothetical protein